MGPTRMHTQLCEEVANIQLLLLGACACVGRLKALASKVYLLMRAVSRLRLQMNTMQSPVWPFTALPSFLHFSAYLLFSLRNTMCSCIIGFIFRDLTVPIPSLLFRNFPDDPKAEWKISMVSSVILKHIKAQAFNLVCSALHKTLLRLFPCHFRFNANMLFLCSCVYNAHIGFMFFTIALAIFHHGTSFLATVLSFDVVRVAVRTASSSSFFAQV